MRTIKAAFSFEPRLISNTFFYRKFRNDRKRSHPRHVRKRLRRTGKDKSSKLKLALFACAIFPNACDFPFFDCDFSRVYFFANFLFVQGRCEYVEYTFIAISYWMHLLIRVRNRMNALYKRCIFQNKCACTCKVSINKIYV